MFILTTGLSFREVVKFNAMFQLTTWLISLIFSAYAVVKLCGSKAVKPLLFIFNIGVKMSFD